MSSATKTCTFKLLVPTDLDTIWPSLAQAPLGTNRALLLPISSGAQHSGGHILQARLTSEPATYSQRAWKTLLDQARDWPSVVQLEIGQL